MPRSSSGAEPDPLAKEVDRLLAQLAGSGGHHPAPASRASPARGITRVSSSKPATSRSAILGLWARVVLVATLGGLMTQWPYPRACGWPLAGYLGAVTIVILAGVWIAVVSWRLRTGAAHVLAFLLLLWGLVLSAERILPRTGYAAERASWRCSGPEHPPG